MLKRIGQEVLKGLIAFLVIVLVVGLVVVMSMLSWVAEWFMNTWTIGLPWGLLIMALMVISGCIMGAIEGHRRNGNRRQDAKTQEGSDYGHAGGKRAA